MADKGFDIKVLIPSDDGITISENGIINASYYLMYNVSNRSYQLAGKIKTSELFNYKKFEKNFLNNFCNLNYVDKIINPEAEVELITQIIHVKEKEIGECLNNIIDQIDKKKI